MTMHPPPESPLTIAHLEQIRNALDICRNGKAQIELAKRAGIDVTELEKTLTDAENKLRQIKQVYFPGH